MRWRLRGGGITTTGLMTATAGLVVGGTTQLNNDVGIGGNLTVAGASQVSSLTVNSTFQVVGTSTLGPVNCLTTVAVGGLLTATAGATIGGTVTLNNDLRVMASSTLGTLAAVNATTFPYNLYVNGNAGIPGGVWINSTSRAVLKQHIRPLEAALPLLRALQPRQWEWADDQPALATGMPGTQTGFVVEEVQRVAPQWTPVDRTGMPGLQMRGLEAVLVQAVQEVLARLEVLEGR